MFQSRSSKRSKLSTRSLQSKKTTSLRTNPLTSFQPRTLRMTSQLSKSLSFSRMLRIKARRNPTLMKMERWYSSNTFLKRFKCSSSKCSKKGWCNSSSRNFCSNSSKWQSNKILGSQRCLVCLTEFNLTRTSATSLLSLFPRPSRDTLTWLLVLIHKAGRRGRATQAPQTKEICSLR